MVKQIRLLILPVSLFFLLTHFNSFLYAQEGGTLTQDANWTISDSPVTVSDSLIIGEDATLTIDPGVEVRFEPQTALIVAGSLVAGGSDSEPVLFTSAASGPEPGDWAGITFERLNDAGSVLEYAVVEYAGYGSTNSSIYYRTSAFGVPVSHTTIQSGDGNGIDTRSSSPVLTNLTVTDNAGYGVFSDLFSNFELSNSTISGNSAGGVHVPINTSPVITDNVIENNDYGIYNSDDASTTIHDNQILDNRIGIYFTELGSDRPDVRNNHIAGNTEFGIRNATSAGRQLDATRNFWGDDTGPFDPVANPSGEGDRVSSFVDYDPWLIEADDLDVTEITNDIESDQIWSEGVYWIRSSVNVTSGNTLTIEPGVIVKLGNGVRLQVFGQLIAQGSESDRIVFTSENDDSYGGDTNNDPGSIPSSGDWSQIYLRNPGSVIEHSLIRFGGGNNAAIYARDGSYTLNHLEILNSGNDGIRFFSGEATVSMSGITANNNRGSGISAVSDYVLEITDSEFKFNDDYGIDASGQNARIQLLQNSVVAENGSGGVTNTTADGEQTFAENEIRKNDRYGLWVENSSETIVFDGNIIEDNQRDGIVSTAASFTANEIRGNRYPIGVVSYLGNTYTDDLGNDTNIIEDNRYDNAISVYSGIRGTMGTVFPESMPEPVYVAVENISIGNGLEIEPGVFFKVQGSNWIRVSSELNAVGTSDDPVVFTSWRDDERGGATRASDDNEPVGPGDWDELDFRSGSENSRLEHVIVSYGRTNLIFRENMEYTVRNIHVHDGSNRGIQLQTRGQVTFNTITVENNDSEGIYIFGDNEAIVRNSYIRNNGDNGLAATSGSSFREVSNTTIEDNDGHGVWVDNSTIPQSFSGNIIRNNSDSGIWNNNSVAAATELQFIGNIVTGNSREGIVSSRARFVDNSIRENRYPIGVMGRSGNIYTDNQGNDNNVIEDNVFNRALAVYSGIRSRLTADFPGSIPEPVYVAVQNISISNDLEIDPGVIIKVEDSNWIRVSAVLEAVGNETDPIVFTSWRDTTRGGWTHHPDDTDVAEPGDWDQLDFRSGAASSRLEHAVVAYGNNNVIFRENMEHAVRHLHSHHSSGRGVQVQTSGRVSLEYATIENNSDEGIYIFGNNEASVRNSIIRNNGGEGLRSTSGSSFRVVSETVIEGNDGDGILIDQANIPQTLSGNTIQTNSGHGMRINSLNNDVDTLLVISGNQVLDNDHVGIYSSRALISDNTISGNRFGLGVQEQLSLEDSGNPYGNVYSGNSIQDNTYPASAIKLGSSIYGRIGYTAPQDIDREAGERPVFVAKNHHVSVSSNREIDIAPGTIFKLDGRRMQIDGKITAAGKAEDKIVFTSWKDDTYGGDTNADSTATVPEPGDWSNLRIYSSDDDSYMSHVIVRYASWNLDIRNNEMVIDSLFSSHASNNGLYIRDASPTINYSEIHSNPTGIFVTGSSEPVIRLSNIRDNEDYGLENSSGNTTTAVDNYWGHESGPFVDDSEKPNLGGEGNEIRMGSAGNVDYDPWLTDRTGILLGDVSESGMISAFDASLVLQYLVDAIELSTSQLQAADVMGTGTVTAMDASYILQFVVGKISGFPGMGRRLPEPDIRDDLFLVTEATDRYLDVTIGLETERDAFATDLVLEYDSDAISEVEHLKTSFSDHFTLFTNDKDGKFMLAAAASEPFNQPGDIIHLRLHLDQETDLRGRNLFSLDTYRFNRHDLTHIFSDMVTSASEQLTDIPDEFKLQQNYPNPFNPTTTIPFQLPVDGNVTLTVYNILGQQVQVLVREEMQAGYHEAVLDASRLASGTYIYRIEIQSDDHQSFIDNGKMILVK